MKTLNKTLAVLVGAVMLLSFSYADTTKEIEKLQKELKDLKQEKEILELKAEIEALKKGEDSKESKGNDVQNANVDKKGFMGFCKGESYHTGCFIGLDFEVGEASYNFDFDETVDSDGAGTMQRTYASAYKGLVTTLPFNVNFGYQWLNKSNYGVRVKGYLGYGYYSSGKIDITLFGDQYTGASQADRTAQVTITAHALNYGVSAAFIWNFVNSYKHSFGLNVGLGLEGTSFVYAEAKSEMQGASAKQKFNMDSAFTFVSFAGLQYIFKSHHQVFLGYKINNYSGIKGKSGGAGNLKITPYSSYVIGYAYKF